LTGITKLSFQVEEAGEAIAVIIFDVAFRIGQFATVDHVATLDIETGKGPHERAVNGLSRIGGIVDKVLHVPVRGSGGKPGIGTGPVHRCRGRGGRGHRRLGLDRGRATSQRRNGEHCHKGCTKKRSLHGQLQR
jgi:hypothetical protein